MKITIRIFVALRPIFWLIQLLRIFSRTSVFHFFCCVRYPAHDQFRILCLITCPWHTSTPIPYNYASVPATSHTRLNHISYFCHPMVQIIIDTATETFLHASVLHHFLFHMLISCSKIDIIHAPSMRDTLFF